MIKSIITVETKKGTHILSKKCKEIQETKLDKIKEIIKDLMDTANSCKNPRAIGLAASQIGYPVRGFIIRWGSDWLALVNPKVVSRSEATRPYVETCLSRPGMAGIKTKRHKIIVLEYFDVIRKQMITRKFSSLDAVVVQHEMDHLEGVLV